MKRAELWFESGDTSLDVRHMRVREALDTLFSVEVVARSTHDDLDLSTFVGRKASLSVEAAVSFLGPRARIWSGRCISMRSTRTESSKLGLSTYELVIVPELWLLTQRRTQRQFQHVALPDIVDAVLADWKIAAEWRIDRAAYPKLALRTQYDETDFAFFSRLLEEAGITFTFEDAAEGARLVLSDEPAKTPIGVLPPIPFVDDPTGARQSGMPFATALQVHEHARPGSMILRDYDPMHPRFQLFAGATSGPEHEQQYEHYHYVPGAFLREEMQGGETPVADDRGVARFDSAFGQKRAQIALEALRSGRKVVTFETSLLDTAPGTHVRIANHPRGELLGPGLIVRSFFLEGEINSEWTRRAEAVPFDEPIRPAQVTPKPRMRGLQVAVVVGSEPGSIATSGEPMRSRLPGSKAPEPVQRNIPGDDVYTDEYGRVRVQFPWDRDGKHSAESSIWMRVAQGWAGAGHGLFSIPRIGTEVLVAYVDGDPDAPMVVGTLHNMVTPAPYKLPDNRSVTTWRTATSPGRGGFNELRFDDTAGREHLYMQAENDMDHLVKNDKQEAVGRDRASYVQRDETRAVGHNLLDVIKTNAMNVIGANASAAVGLTRTSSVGVEDTTTVGSRWSISVARGLSATLGPKLAHLLDGALGPVMASAAPTVLGRVTSAPLGGVEGGAAASLAAFRSTAPNKLLQAIGLGGGGNLVEGPPPTTIEVVDRRIELTTGEASIILDGPNISLRATGNIVVDALKSVSATAEEEIAIGGRERVALVSLSDDVIVQASKKVKLNPFEKSAAPPASPRGEDAASPTLSPSGSSGDE